MKFASSHQPSIKNPDINRAIVECVANMQKGKG